MVQLRPRRHVRRRADPLRAISASRGELGAAARFTILVKIVHRFGVGGANPPVRASGLQENCRAISSGGVSVSARLGSRRRIDFRFGAPIAFPAASVELGITLFTSQVLLIATRAGEESCGPEACIWSSRRTRSIPTRSSTAMTPRASTTREAARPAVRAAVRRDRLRRALRWGSPPVANGAGPGESFLPISGRCRSSAARHLRLGRLPCPGAASTRLRAWPRRCCR